MNPLLPLVGTLLFSGCVFRSHPLEEQISKYRGDGAIRETSISSLLFSSPGFSLCFPKFDSVHEYAASYRISHLPKTKSRLSLIYLRFESSCDSQLLKDKFKGSVRYTIESNEGEVLWDKVLPFERAIWSQSGGRFGLYDSSVSEFEFENSKEYLLRVHYSPDVKDLPFAHCYVSIESGGYK